MKKLKLLFSLLFVGFILFSCNKTKLVHNTQIFAKDEVFFNINLKDNINFQPMHVEMGKDRGFAILGQFNKKGDAINFKLYNAHTPINSPKDSIYLKIKNINEIKCNKESNKPDVICLRVDLEKVAANLNVKEYPFQLNRKLGKRDGINLSLFIHDEEYPSKINLIHSDKNIGGHICKSILLEETGP